MSTNADFDFDFDFEEPKTNRIKATSDSVEINRIKAASDSVEGFDFDDEFLNDTSGQNTIEPKKSVSEQKKNDISFDFEENEDNKQNTGVDNSFSFDFEKEDSTIPPKKDDGFSFEIDTEQEPKKSDFDIGFETEKSDFDNDFMIGNIETQKEEPKKFDSFDAEEMDEDQNIPISKNNDKKFDYSINNDIIENNDFDNNESNIKKKGFFMAKNKKEDVQEEVFDDELDENHIEEETEEETEEKPKPIYFQKWFIPAVGGVLFAGFIGVKIMNGGIGGGNIQPVQQLTQQNQPIQQPPAMFEESKPEANALQEPMVTAQQQPQQQSISNNEQQPMPMVNNEQQPMVTAQQQQPSISNNEMIRMVAEQKQLLDEQMQETNLKINNQNIRLDKIENNIGQISNNMVLIATSLTELKNSFESKQAKASVTPKLEKEKVKTKETVISETRHESISKHSNHYHNTRVSQEKTYSKKNETLYGNVKMAVNGSAWVVNSKGETVELRTGDYNSQYGKILYIDENNLIVKTSKGSLHSNY